MYVYEVYPLGFHQELEFYTVSLTKEILIIRRHLKGVGLREPSS